MGCKGEVIEKKFWCSRVVCTVLQEREEVKKEEKWRKEQMKANTCQIVNTQNNQYFYFFLIIQLTLIRLVDQGLLQSMKKAPN